MPYTALAKSRRDRLALHLSSFLTQGSRVKPEPLDAGVGSFVHHGSMGPGWPSCQVLRSTSVVEGLRVASRQPRLVPGVRPGPARALTDARAYGAAARDDVRRTLAAADGCHAGICERRAVASASRWIPVCGCDFISCRPNQEWRVSKIRQYKLWPSKDEWVSLRT